MGCARGQDLHVAVLVVREEPSGSVFHSQQCAQKSENALLAFRNVDFRRTHDLRELGNQCAALEPSLIPLLTEAADLTDYAVVFRYLDAPREPDAEEAEAALATARTLYTRICAILGE